jgi:hypothetical protein
MCSYTSGRSEIFNHSWCYMARFVDEYYQRERSIFCHSLWTSEPWATARRLVIGRKKSLGDWIVKRPCVYSDEKNGSSIHILTIFAYPRSSGCEWNFRFFHQSKRKAFWQFSRRDSSSCLMLRWVIGRKKSLGDWIVKRPCVYSDEKNGSSIHIFCHSLWTSEPWATARRLPKIVRMWMELPFFSSEVGAPVGGWAKLKIPR